MKYIYTVEFNGRDTGAIGLPYPRKVTMKSEVPIQDKEVWLSLYEKPHGYECITDLHINSRKVNIGEL